MAAPRKTIHAIASRIKCCAIIYALGIPLVHGISSPYQTTLSFPGYNQSAVLTNFPALVVLNEQIHGFRYSQFASSNGTDLRFSDPVHSNALSYEIESWNTNGNSYVWVKVPALHQDATVIAHWGDVTAVISPAYTTNGTVWSEHYEAVLHLNGTNLPDASARGFDGQNFGSTAVPGIIAQARNFEKSGNQYINCGPGLTISNRSFTVSAWAKRDLTGSTAEGYLVSHGSAGPPDRRGLHIGFRGGSEADLFALGFWGDDVNSLLTYPDTNQWHLWTATYEFSTKTQRLYVDGKLMQTRVTADHYQGLNGTDLYIGSRFDNVAFDGGIDEVRISSIDRSSNWIWAAYLNTISNASFLSFGVITGGPPPFIMNQGETSDITPHTASANGMLSTTGQAPTTVIAYYGKIDGSTNKGSWNHVMMIGNQGEGPVTAGLSGLEANTTYAYRFYATNTFGEHWSTHSTFFTTARKQLVPEKYSNRMEIRLDGYTKGETLTNFPLLVVLHEGLVNFRYVDFASPTGGDLRFSDADGVTELVFEIDRWNIAGTSFVWVQVPEVTSNKSIYAYWGRPGATVFPSYTTNGAVWPSSFRTVLHLNTNAAPGTFLDSTSYRLNGTNYGSFDDVGQIGRGRDFNHLSSHRIETGPGLDISNKSFSVSVWARRFTATPADYLLSHGVSGTSSVGLHFGFIGASTFRLSFWADDLDVIDAGFGDTTDWHLWTATFDVATKRQTIYRDGVERASRIAFNPYFGSTSTPLHIAVAHADASSYFDGRIDEVRVAATSFSSNWIWASWMNQKSNAAFSTYLQAEKPWVDRPALDPSSYSHRMKIRFDGYALNETLTNFPLLVSLHSGLAKFNYATFASTYGSDLRFTDAGGVNELSYEIERWNTSGTSHVWVQIPTLTTGSHIYAYWGRPHTPAPPPLGMKLWLKADAGVQTNGSGSITNWLDQSGNANHVAQSVAGNSPSLVPSAMNGLPVARFDGDDQLVKALPSLPADNQPRTVLLVSRNATISGDLYPISYGSADLNQSFGIDLGDNIRIVGFGNDHDIGIGVTTNPQLLGVIYNGASLDSHVDGAPGFPSDRLYDTSVSNLFIGSFTDASFHFLGDIAEVLVYDRVLSAADLHEVGYYYEQKYGLETPYTDGAPYTIDGSTWAEKYHAVLHLDDDFLDASNEKRTINGFGTFDIPGQVARGRQFQKVFSDHLHDEAGLDLSNRSFSMSAWIKRSSAGSSGDGFILSHGTSGINQQGLHFGFRGGAEADTMTFAFWADDLNSYDPSYADTNEWHLWTATYHAGTRLQSLYRDGVLMASRTASANYLGSTSTVLRVGEFFGTSYLDGGMDELRISDAQRSSNWVWASWYSQKSNMAFSTYLPAEPVDQDEDGLPDAWELLYFVDATNAHPAANSDNDELSNLEEYIADTDPLDGDSHFFIDHVSVGSTASILFAASTGRIYTLQYSTNNMQSSWQNIIGQTDIPGFGANSYLSDTNTSAHRQYRVNVELP